MRIVPDQVANKDFAPVVAFSQSLSQWTVAILGGSVGLLLSTSNRRPRDWRVRLGYFIFVPAWGLLLYSMQMALDVQGNVLAFSRLANPNVAATLAELNDHLYSQIHYLEIALEILCSWLLLYLCWWIFSRDEESAAGRGLIL